jgi:SAM-dependent methyltransferase
MDESDYFGRAPIVDAMTAEHRFLWRSFLRACARYMHPGMRVLDFGCGNGGMLAAMLSGDGCGDAGRQCALAVGIDRPSVRAVLAAASRQVERDRRRPARPLVFACTGADAFPEQFDLILSHEVIYLLSDLEETFRSLHGALRPGGALAVTTGCHTENALYPRWRAALAREGVHANPYSILDYVQAVRAAGFVHVESEALTMDVADYEEWLHTRPDPAPNSDWFPTAEDERRYYTRIGKALITARRATP